MFADGGKYEGEWSHDKKHGQVDIHAADAHLRRLPGDLALRSYGMYT